MALLITFDDFSGEIALPDDEQLRADLSPYIDRHEKEFLIKLLGEHLYLEFKDGLAEETPAEKWVKLRDGEEYAVDGLRREYDGLRDGLAHFIFWAFVRETTLKITPMGLIEEDTETGDLANDSKRTSYLQRMYNLGIEAYMKAQDYIEAQNDLDAATYPEYDTTVLEKRFFGGWL